MNFERNLSKCSIKWDLEINRAKDIFKDLGINFLSKLSNNNYFINNENSFKSEKIQLSHDFNCNQSKTNEPNYDPKEDIQISINGLSDELLLKIFKYLSHKSLCRCSQVSKHWNRIALDSSLWKSIDLSKKCLSFSQLQNLLKNGIVSIRLSSTAIIDCYSLSTMTSMNCIENLDLSMAQISAQSINRLLDSNFNGVSLKKLSLESKTINQKTLDLIVGKHKQLEVLNISMTQSIDSQVLMSFNDKLPETMVELNISWITKLDINQMIAFLPKSLKRLNISGFREGFKDKQMTVLVTNSPNLIELDLCDCVLLTEQALDCIQTHLTRLEVLHISRCHRIKDLSALMNMKNLKMVSIEGISLNQNIEWNSIDVNRNFISTIARPKPKLINESYSTIWEIPLKII